MADDLQDVHGEDQHSFYAKQQLITAARTAFQQLAAVMRTSTLYPAAHPFLLSSAEKLLHTLTGLLADRREAAFYLVSGELFFEGNSIPLDQSLSLMIEQITSRKIGGIAFRSGLLPAELIAFVGLVNQEAEFFKPDGEPDAGLLGREHITHIAVHKALVVGKKTQEGGPAEKKKQASTLFLDAVEMVKELVQAIHLEKAVNVRRMNMIVQGMVDNILENRDALMGLTSIRMYDEYTFAHSVNVAVLAISLGTFLSFSKPQVASLGIAAMLHDIGKVSVPIDIINKPGKLTDEEWEIVKRHPVEGALILSGIPGVTKLAMVAAFQHHQHGDERGYPPLEDHDHQHPFAQIVSLCDAYDALTAARVYYSVQMPPDHAIRILLKQRDTTFDATLVKAFVNMIGVFPIGTLLKLDTGEIGLVVHQTRDLLRPRVLILTTFDGNERESGSEVSLIETVSGQYRRSAVGIINPVDAKVDVKQYLE